MTRIEYLRKQVKKYNFLYCLLELGLRVEFIVVGFLAIHMIVYWLSNDYLTKMQIFKYSFSKFWFLYLYVVFMQLNIPRLEGYPYIIGKLTKQIKEEERKAYDTKTD